MLKFLKALVKKEKVKFNLIPYENISYDERQDIFILSGTSGKIKLTPERADGYPTGWCLIRGRFYPGLYLKIQLIVKTKEKLHKIPLPISCKGTLLEVIEIPSKPEEILLELISQDRKIKISEGLYIRPVSEIERLYRMFRRVLFFFKKRYTKQRKLVRLKFLDLLLDLSKAYEKAGLLRDCFWSQNYSIWLKSFYSLEKKDIEKILRDIERLKLNIKFKIFILCAKESDKELKLKRTLDSLQNQLYRNFDFEINFLYKNSTRLKEILDGVQKESSYYIFVPSGTVLSPFSLYLMAKTIQTGNCDLVYTDHDYLNEKEERENPFFKPDFSLEYLRSYNYIDFAFAVSDRVIRELSEFNIDSFFNYGSYEFLLRVTEKISPFSIKHIPGILFTFDKDFLKSLSLHMEIIKSHLKRLNVEAEVECVENKYFKIIYKPIKKPFVTVVIPTKDKVEILKKCMTSIFNKTTYDRYEIVIIDNKSKEKETKEYLKSLSKEKKVRILDYDKPFNYSAMNNLAIRVARGEVIVFLNNDTEIITPEWLEIMLGCLEQPKVGAVGAKLLYPDNTVQHAGVVLGPGGCADHAFKGLDNNNTGYFYRAAVQQEYLAVTGACLMTWKNLFLSLGSFDEVNLINSFQDVDYCLKLIEAGYRIIFTPYVLLYHYESLTRKGDPALENRTRIEANFMRKRWKKYVERDPYYNPNLNYRRPDFTLNPFPKIEKP